MTCHGRSFNGRGEMAKHPCPYHPEVKTTKERLPDGSIIVTCPICGVIARIND